MAEVYMNNIDEMPNLTKLALATAVRKILSEDKVLDTIDQILKNSQVLMMIKNILSTAVQSHDLIVYLHLEATWILINIGFSSSDDL